ncbi:hypothetical protein [Bartonella acomydis]|uniref:Uncharacterized protein n=1 Tax=Bartonella acomydis TaxID=686234 RepID=A0ABP9MQN5_9HYPH
MLSKPFAISEISDPSQVRVVLYTGHGFVHAPLNGILELFRGVLKSDFEDSVKDLEKRLGDLREEVEDLKGCSLDEAL